MTREEARERVNTICTGISDHEITKIFDVLEALGLIKFDDNEKQLFDAIDFARTKSTGSYDIQYENEFIQNLSDRGYEIVKKS